MTIDTRFVVSDGLEALFRDKDTGAPLRNGVIYLWEDEARTIPKFAYKLTGSPPDYTYTALPNPINLSSIGTIQDGGVDLIPYWFTLDGTPETTTNQPALYFVEVYSEGGKDTGVLQFTRQAWPNDTLEAGAQGKDVTNYVPNGQFYYHNNLPETPDFKAGEVRDDITEIAQGGWSFERPAISTATDFVVFERIGSAVVTPVGNPRYKVRISNTVVGTGNAYKDLRLKYWDVNKFASATQFFTYAFSAQSNTGGAVSVGLYLIKNFGTGGDPQTETLLTTFSVGITESIYQFAFKFGTNIGKAIGPNDDDFVQLALRLPTSSLSDASFTDFTQLINNVVISQFPTTTNADFFYKSFVSAVSNPNGMDLYLPLVKTPQGLEFSDTEIGFIYPSAIAQGQVGFLRCDGDKYDPTLYSADGIPYLRLFNKLFDSSINVPLWGTGTDYFVGEFYNSGNELRINNNENGLVTGGSAGTSGFTVSTIHAPVSASTYRTDGFYAGLNLGYLINQLPGSFVGGVDGTSGFTFSIQKDGTPLVNQVDVFNATGAVIASLAGKYFHYTNSVGQWKVWFKVDGAGTEPVVSGTPILISINSTDSHVTLAQKVAVAMNAYQMSSIKTIAASGITAGSYFIISATGDNYYVWYKKDGIGTDPTPGGVGILVEIVTADDATAVARKTQTAVNSKFYAVPDFRSYFLRDSDDDSERDPTRDARFSHVPGVQGDFGTGTEYFDTIYAHSHQGKGDVSTTVPLAEQFNISFVTTPPTNSAYTEDTGMQQSAPINKSIRYYIKY